MPSIGLAKIATIGGGGGGQFAQREVWYDEETTVVTISLTGIVVSIPVCMHVLSFLAQDIGMVRVDLLDLIHST